MDKAQIIGWIITIMGFVVTIYVMHKQFSNQRKEKNIDLRLNIYMETYHDVDEIKNDITLLCSKNYFERVNSHKYKIKLTSSNLVMAKYEQYLELVNDCVNKYQDAMITIDPTTDHGNYEIIYDDDGQVVDEQYRGPDYDPDMVEVLLKKEEQKISSDCKEKAFDIASNMLKSMRSDLETN